MSKPKYLLNDVSAGRPIAEGMAGFHPQAVVCHPRHGDIEVDERLAPLLTRLWGMGIETYVSCQNTIASYETSSEFWMEHSGWVWVRTDAASARRLVAAIRPRRQPIARRSRDRQAWNVTFKVGRGLSPDMVLR